MPNNDLPRGIDEKLEVITSKVMDATWAAYARITQSLDCRRHRGATTQNNNQTHVERAVESRNTSNGKTI